MPSEHTLNLLAYVLACCHSFKKIISTEVYRLPVLDQAVNMKGSVTLSWTQTGKSIAR